MTKRHQDWITPSVFEWSRFTSGGILSDIQVYRRAYDYWRRAEHLLRDDVSDLARGDAIANLKRSLNHRLLHLEKLYRFSSLDIPIRPKGSLERLELLGLVRPFLLRSLMDIRNAFEHRDAKPPSNKRCQEFLDIMWYFLRSTDPIVQHQPTEVEFTGLAPSNSSQIEYQFTLGMEYGKKPLIEINGWFPTDAVSETAVYGFLCVTANRPDTLEQDWYEAYRKGRLETDRWIDGRLLDPNDLVIAFRAMLNTY